MVVLRSVDRFLDHHNPDETIWSTNVHVPCVSSLTAASVCQRLCLLPDVMSAQEQRGDVDVGERHLFDGLRNDHRAADGARDRHATTAVVGART